MFTFVPSHKQIFFFFFFFLQKDVTERLHSYATTPQSCIIYRDPRLEGGRWQWWSPRDCVKGGGGAGERLGGFALSPRQLSPQPSARRRTIHSLITCQSLHPKLALYLFICWGVIYLFILFFLALSVASEINSHSRLELKGRMGRKEQNNWMENAHTDHDVTLEGVIWVFTDPLFVSVRCRSFTVRTCGGWFSPWEVSPPPLPPLKDGSRRRRGEAVGGVRFTTRELKGWAHLSRLSFLPGRSCRCATFGQK